MGLTVVDLLSFIPLAVLTNTVFPVPFEPVLLWFAGRAAPGDVWIYPGVGSACAGLGAALDANVVGAVSRRWRGRRGIEGELPHAGARFYLGAFVAALLPIPFSTIRLTLLRVRPRLPLYALIVAGARLPRYLLTVVLWRSLTPPGWVAGALLFGVVGYLILARQRSAARARPS